MTLRGRFSNGSTCNSVALSDLQRSERRRSRDRQHGSEAFRYPQRQARADCRNGTQSRLRRGLRAPASFASPGGSRSFWFLERPGMILLPHSSGQTSQHSPPSNGRGFLWEGCSGSAQEKRNVADPLTGRRAAVAIWRYAIPDQCPVGAAIADCVLPSAVQAAAGDCQPPRKPRRSRATF